MGYVGRLTADISDTSAAATGRPWETPLGTTGHEEGPLGAQDVYTHGV